MLINRYKGGWEKKRLSLDALYCPTLSRSLLLDWPISLPWPFCWGKLMSISSVSDSTGMFLWVSLFSLPLLSGSLSSDMWFSSGIPCPRNPLKLEDATRCQPAFPAPCVCKRLVLHLLGVHILQATSLSSTSKKGRNHVLLGIPGQGLVLHQYWIRLLPHFLVLGPLGCLAEHEEPTLVPLCHLLWSKIIIRLLGGWLACHPQGFLDWGILRASLGFSSLSLPLSNHDSSFEWHPILLDNGAR